VVGYCERGDEPLGSGATDLVSWLGKQAIYEGAVATHTAYTVDV
jgi:hypothetical protein